MAEEQKNQLGDGSDNYAGAAKQMANAAKEALDVRPFQLRASAR